MGTLYKKIMLLSLSLICATACATPTPLTQMPAKAATLQTIITCPTKRPEICTQDYNPVCATKDTGIRCVTTPCPSEIKATYSNGCSACADPKVSHYLSGTCPS